MSFAQGTLVDTNVLIDVIAGDSEWTSWSLGQMSAALERGEVVINPIVYAELAVGFTRIEDLDGVLPPQIEVEAIPKEAAFLAGRAYRQHLDRGGSRTSPLPDFFIAAHAAVTGRALLTRDRARQLRAVPAVTVISPPN